MKIIFLGTGAGMPSKDRNLSSIYLNHGNEHWLWDCGEGTQMQLLKANISWMKINRIFITHFHADHFVGLIGLIQSMNLEGRNEPLEIYGPDAERFITDIIDLGYWGLGFPVISKNIDYDKITKIIDSEKFEVYSIPVKHSVPAVGYYFKEKEKIKLDMKKAEEYGLKEGPHVKKIKEDRTFLYQGENVFWDFAKSEKGKTVAYSGDTLIHEPFFEFIENCDLLIHDTTFAEKETNHSHSTIEDVAKMCKKYNIKKLIGTHISRRYRNPEELEKLAKRYFENSSIAYDFMEVNV